MALSMGERARESGGAAAGETAAAGSRVLVGVPTQTLHAIDGIPEGIPHSWVMSTRYMTALAQVGAVPVMIPLLDDDEATVRSIYDRLDGIFLAGGVDVHSSAYGEPPGEFLGRTDHARDTVELALARWAVADGKPLLGVCRGLHVLNVALGGTLYQDTTEFTGSIKHDYFPTQGFTRDHLAHEIDVAAGSRLAAAFGPGRVLINSMHHQAIRDLGRGLRPSALAPDGLIEAAECGLEDTFCVAVQWHPEALIDADAGTARLFAAFANACRVWRQSGSGTATLRAFTETGARRPPA